MQITETKERTETPKSTTARIGEAYLKEVDKLLSLSTSFVKLSCALIDPNPFQPRVTPPDPEMLQQLAETIKIQGQMYPIEVRPSSKEPGRFELVTGKRRLEAIKTLLKQPTISTIVRECSNEDLRKRSLIENIQRENLSSSDFAKSVQELHSMLKSHESVAKAIGKSVKMVQRNMRIAEASEVMATIPSLPEMDFNTTLKTAAILNKAKSGGEEVQKKAVKILDKVFTETKEIKAADLEKVEERIFAVSEKPASKSAAHHKSVTPPKDIGPGYNAIPGGGELLLRFMDRDSQKASDVQFYKKQFKKFLKAVSVSKTLKKPLKKSGWT